MKMGMNLLSVVCRPQVHKKGKALKRYSANARKKTEWFKRYSASESSKSQSVKACVLITKVTLPSSGVNQCFGIRLRKKFCF